MAAERYIPVVPSLVTMITTQVSNSLTRTGGTLITVSLAEKFGPYLIRTAALLFLCARTA
jgi:hypothetical protein